MVPGGQTYDMMDDLIKDWGQLKKNGGKNSVFIKNLWAQRSGGQLSEEDVIQSPCSSSSSASHPQPR